MGKQFAIVCNPHVPSAWHETDVLLRRVIDPLCHAVALCCYVAVAVIHFVLPQLRDLVGNMIMTMCICLAVGQVADTVRIFTEFTSPTAYLVAGQNYFQNSYNYNNICQKMNFLQDWFRMERIVLPTVFTLLRIQRSFVNCSQGSSVLKTFVGHIL